jgi:ribosomal protein L37AE/L43A
MSNESPTVDADLRFSFRCPSCGAKCKSKVKHVGKRVDCPKCGASIAVPSYSGRGEQFEDLEMTDLLKREPGRIQPDAPTIKDWQATPSQSGSGRSVEESLFDDLPSAEESRVRFDAISRDDDSDDDQPSIDLTMRAKPERRDGPAVPTWAPGTVAIIAWMFLTTAHAAWISWSNTELPAQVYTAFTSSIGASNLYWAVFLSIRAWRVAKFYSTISGGALPAFPQFIRYLMAISTSWFGIGAVSFLLTVPYAIFSNENLGIVLAAIGMYWALSLVMWLATITVLGVVYFITKPPVVYAMPAPSLDQERTTAKSISLSEIAVLFGLLAICAVCGAAIGVSARAIYPLSPANVGIQGRFDRLPIRANGAQAQQNQQMWKDMIRGLANQNQQN